MNIDQVFTQAIAALNGTTQGIQELVRIRPWISEDLYGKRSFGATRKYKAVVTRNAGEVRTRDGRTINIRAVVAFLRPITPIGAVGRQEPIDPRDEIYLVDDVTGPIISISGPTNPPATKVRYFQQVTLG